MLFFKDAKLAINGTGLIADSASIDFTNNINPILAVGKRGMVNMVPNGQTSTTLSFNYLVEPGNEPIKGIVDYLKNNQDTAGTAGVCVELGGISGIYYLDSYGVKVGPNDSASSSATFVSFQAVSGDLVDNPSVALNPRNDSGIAHSYTTTFYNGANQVTNRSLLGFEYSFKANWNPFFILGRKEPIQLNLGSAQETVTLEQEFFYNLPFSGENLASAVPIDKVKLFELGYLASGTGYFIDFPLDGLTRNVSVQASTDEMVKVRISAEREYH